MLSSIQKIILDRAFADTPCACWNHHKSQSEAEGNFSTLKRIKTGCLDKLNLLPTEKPADSAPRWLPTEKIPRGLARGRTAARFFFSYELCYCLGEKSLCFIIFLLWTGESHGSCLLCFYEEQIWWFLDFVPPWPYWIIRCVLSCVGLWQLNLQPVKRKVYDSLCQFLLYMYWIFHSLPIIVVTHFLGCPSCLYMSCLYIWLLFSLALWSLRWPNILEWTVDLVIPI